MFRDVIVGGHLARRMSDLVYNMLQKMRTRMSALLEIMQAGMSALHYSPRLLAAWA